MYKFFAECDLKCLENIVRSKKNANTFEEFYKTSETEAKSLVPQSASFISKLKKEIPQLYMDLFSTFFPLDGKVIKNLELLMRHFGIEKVKSYPSLFLATAFIRRRIGVETSVEAPCGGIDSCFISYYGKFHWKHYAVASINNCSQSQCS